VGWKVGGWYSPSEFLHVYQVSFINKVPLSEKAFEGGMYGMDLFSLILIANPFFYSVFIRCQQELDILLQNLGVKDVTQACILVADP
jgi:hypothetical protein